MRIRLGTLRKLIREENAKQCILSPVGGELEDHTDGREDHAVITVPDEQEDEINLTHVTTSDQGHVPGRRGSIKSN